MYEAALLFFLALVVIVGVAIGLSRSRLFRDNPKAKAYWFVAASLLIAIPTIIEGMRTRDKGWPDYLDYLNSVVAICILLGLARNAWRKADKP